MPLWRSPRFRCDTNQAVPIVRNTNETPAKAKPTTYQTPVIVLQAGPYPRPKVAAWGAGFGHQQSRGRVQCPLPHDPGVSLAAGPGVGLRRGQVFTHVAHGADRLGPAAIGGYRQRSDQQGLAAAASRA